MPLKIQFAIFVLLCLLGCETNGGKKKNEINLSFISLLKQSENEQIPFEKRLFFALQADSIANATNNSGQHLEATRTLADIHLMMGNLTQAQVGYMETANLARKQWNVEYLGFAYQNIGICYDSRGDYDSALKYYDDGLQIFLKNGNQLQIARGMVNIGIVYLNLENYDTAFKISLNAVKIFDSLKLKKKLPSENEIAAALTTLGIILKQQDQFDEALQYHERALQILKKENDSAGIASAMLNIGNIYRYKKQYRQALDYYMTSLNIKQKRGLFKYTGAVLENIAEVHAIMKDFEIAEEYFNKSINVEVSNHDKDGEISTLNKLSKLYLDKNNLFKAKEIGIQVQHLLPQSGQLKPRLQNATVLSEIFITLNQKDSALKYVNNALILKDSVYDIENANTITKLNTRFKTEQKEKELLLSKKLQLIQFSKIRGQRIFIFLLIAFLSALLYLVFLLYRSNRKVINANEKLSQANKKIETLMQELNHRVKNNLQIVADMLYLQQGMMGDDYQAALLQASIDRIDSMNVIHNLLCNREFNGSVNMRDFMDELVANLVHTYQEQSALFQITTLFYDAELDIDKAIPLGLIANELIINTFKYSKPVKGISALKIGFTFEDSCCLLSISDNCGYWNIQDQLAKRHGLGLYLVETLSKQLSAVWLPVSDERGTTHSITFNS